MLFSISSGVPGEGHSTRCQAIAPCIFALIEKPVRSLDERVDRVLFEEGGPDGDGNVQLLFAVGQRGGLHEQPQPVAQMLQIPPGDVADDAEKLLTPQRP